MDERRLKCLRTFQQILREKRETRRNLASMTMSTFSQDEFEPGSHHRIFILESFFCFIMCILFYFTLVNESFINFESRISLFLSFLFSILTLLALNISQGWKGIGVCLNFLIWFRAGYCRESKISQYFWPKNLNIVLATILWGWLIGPPQNTEFFNE